MVSPSKSLVNIGKTLLSNSLVILHLNNHFFQKSPEFQDALSHGELWCILCSKGSHSTHGTHETTLVVVTAQCDFSHLSGLHLHCTPEQIIGDSCR